MKKKHTNAVSTADAANSTTAAASKKKKAPRKSELDRLADLPYPPYTDDDEHDIDAPQLPHSSFPNLLASYRNAPEPITERYDTGIREPNDGLTPGQRRMRYLSTCDPAALDECAADPIEEVALRARSNEGLPSNIATITRTRPRDTSAGVYVATIEQFNQRVAAMPMELPDQNAAALLIKEQPWRKACALTEDKQSQPVPTFGPMLLPESHDPVAALEHPPTPELRPKHWSPDAHPSDILMGIVHDLANCASALSARLAVSLGHQPDTEAVANLRTLTRSAKTIQNILHTEEDRRAARHAQAMENAAPITRKPGPGRPRKLRLPEDSPAVTLRVELIEKRKKFGRRKTTTLTPEEPTPEVVKNTGTGFSEPAEANPAESKAEVVKNKTPEIPGDASFIPGSASVSLAGAKHRNLPSTAKEPALDLPGERAINSTLPEASDDLGENESG